MACRMGVGVLLLFMGIFRIASAVRCLGPMWGDECVHLCQCRRNDATCTNHNGGCDKCGWSYGGPSCQMWDASLHQVVTMNGAKFYPGDGREHKDLTGEHTVDFDDNTDLMKCALSYRLPEAPPLIIRIDLGRPVDIVGILLLGANYDHPLKSKIKIEVDDEVCIDRNLSYAPPQAEEIHCDFPTSGQEVLLTSHHTMIKMCEISVWECAGGTYGPGCKRQCRCKDPMEACDRFTGRCKTGCRAGYRGEECQERNVALGRPATAPNWRGATAAMPVEGHSGFLTDGLKEVPIMICTETLVKGAQKGKVTVLLASPTTFVRSVVIYGHFKKKKRLEGIEVKVIGYVNNKRGNQDKPQLCGRHESSHHIPGAKVTVTCPEVLVGDRVTVERYDPKPPTDKDITICEIEVWECADGTWGSDCQHTCKCAEFSEVCHKVTGQCSSGCAAGYYGPGCLTECPPNKWGENCAKTCHCFEHDAICRPSDGNCSLGCAAGWTGPGCSDKCEKGKFGMGCAFDCPDCLNGTCSPETGVCQDCPLQADGISCAQECDQGYFGRECWMECNCKDLDEACHYVTGACEISGCADHSYGSNCQIFDRAQEDYVVVTDHLGKSANDLLDGSSDTCVTLKPSSRGQTVYVELEMTDVVQVNKIILTRPGTRKQNERPYVINMDDDVCNDDVNLKVVSDEFRCTKPSVGTKIRISRTDENLELCEIQVWECADYMWGEDCQHQCNCISPAEECSKITGKCNKGQCADNFRGSSCQMQNIALRKPAQQSSVMFYDQTQVMQFPSLAVDGFLNPAPGHCAVTQGYHAAWWELDLLKPVSINRITLLTEQYSTYNKMHLRVLVDDQVCMERVDEKLRPAVQEDLFCTTNRRGQRVRFTHPDRLRLCEVMVWECVDGTWGRDCAGACKCEDPNEMCNKFDGRCQAILRSGEAQQGKGGKTSALIGASRGHGHSLAPSARAICLALPLVMLALQIQL